MGLASNDSILLNDYLVREYDIALADGRSVLHSVSLGLRKFSCLVQSMLCVVFQLPLR